MIEDCFGYFYHGGDVEETFWFPDCVPCGALREGCLLLLEVESELALNVFEVCDEEFLLCNNVVEFFVGGICRTFSKDLL